MLQRVPKPMYCFKANNCFWWSTIIQRQPNMCIWIQMCTCMKCYQGSFCLFRRKRIEFILFTCVDILVGVCLVYCRYRTHLFSHLEMAWKRFKPQYLLVVCMNEEIQKYNSRHQSICRNIKTKNNIFIVYFSLFPLISCDIVKHELLTRIRVVGYELQEEITGESCFKPHQCL